MSLGDSHIKHVCARLASLSMLTVRVYSGPGVQPATYNLVLCEFGGFENVLCDAGVRDIPT